MSKLKQRINDQRVLNLIRKYLNAGVLVKGKHVILRKGVPQGSPLSPLLSNIILDELDKELERRGHQFVRYADDCNVLVKSQRSGERVLKSLSRYIEVRLKLKVNRDKSAVDEVGNRKFLGYTCCNEGKETRLLISNKSIKAFKEKIKTLTKIRGGKSFRDLLRLLKPVMIGWKNYFILTDDKKVFNKLDGWIRRRLRACAYSLMKKGSNRLSYFIRQGIAYGRAYKCAFSSKGIWHASRGDVMQQVLNNNRLRGLGLCPLSD